MKYLKMLGVAIVAVVALTAWFGAGSASATVLCKSATNPCLEKWPAGTQLDLELAKKGVWEDSIFGTIFQECTYSTIKGKVSTAGNAFETVKAPLEAVYWGNPESTCSREGDLLLRWGELEIHSIPGTNNGTLTDITTQWTIAGTNCVYGFTSGTDIGTIKGGNPATVEINVIVPPLSGTCTTKYRWTATYQVSQPAPLYVEPS